MKEIGGYFGLEQLISNEYYKDLIALNTARNALLYILKARKIRKLYIPYYLCDSVSKMCKCNGYEYEYYYINPDFTPCFQKTLFNDEFLYVVNYYGQLDNEYIRELKERFNNIIIDNVHAFFQKPVEGVDTIYSCRKFFGVPDGAYLSTNCFLKEELETDISMNRMEHLLGRLEYGNASTYFECFRQNDESFDTISLKRMSKLTHNLVGAIDYETVRETREDNFLFLHEALGDRNKLDINIPVAPFAYPFYSENGLEIKKHLAKENIYVPTLWPNVLNSQDCVAKDYAANILPLPCDQRYQLYDIEKILKELLCIS